MSKSNSRMLKRVAVCVGAVTIVLAGQAVGSAEPIVKPHTFSAGAAAVAQHVNENFDALFAAVNQLARLVPAGTVSAYAGNVVPSGYYECNGQLVRQADDPALFAAIGTRYGASGASFNVPDYRGHFLRAWDNGRGVDSNRQLGAAQADELKAHTHTYDDLFRRIQNQNVDLGGDQIPPASDANLESLNRTTASTGGIETRPKNISVMYIIKR